MRKVKYNNWFKRLLATVLSAVMVLSVMPFTNISLSANDAGVTVKVTDDSGNAIKGASVTYHINSAANGNDHYSGTVTSDDSGNALVLTKDKFVAEDLTLASATITKSGYDNGSISNQSITSAGQDFTVKLTQSTVPNITVTPTSETYNGKEHVLATISGTKDGDTITYKLDDADWTEWNQPSKTEAGDYTLKVKVRRAGYQDYETTVYPVVKKADIELNVTPYSGDYDGNEHPALTVDGIKPGDNVTYSMDGNSYSESPTISDAGDYSVTLTVIRDNTNYKKYEQTFTAKINPVDITGITVNPYNDTYDGESHSAIVSVSGTRWGDTVGYSLSEDGPYVESLQDSSLSIKNVGDYAVWVRVTRRGRNYRETKIHSTAKITKADQTLVFNTDAPTGTVTRNGAGPYEGLQYDFSAYGNTSELDNGVISYSVESTRTNGAEIDANGTLTVHYPGTITVTATRKGNDNYNDGKVTQTFTVRALSSEPGEFLKFENSRIDYVFDTKAGTVSTQKVTAESGIDAGFITYSLTSDPAGLTIETNGKNAHGGLVTITDYAALAEAMHEAGGALDIEVRADLSNAPDYGDDFATYILHIAFAPKPGNEPYYTITPAADPETGWYNGKTGYPTVKPTAEGYEIAVDKPENFSSTQKIRNEGEQEHCVYLKNAAEGEGQNGITDQIPVNVKIDTATPYNVDISYPRETGVIGRIEDFLDRFSTYGKTIKVKVTAIDATSGLDYVTWYYPIDESGVITSATESDTVEFNENGEVIFTVPKNNSKKAKGKVGITVTDKAGNTTNLKTDDGNELIIDNVDPELTITYPAPLNTVEADSRKHHYYNGSIPFTIKVTEDYFDGNDFEFNVYDAEGNFIRRYYPSFTNAKDENDNPISNIHIATVTLDSDGDYVVSARCKDKAGNESAPFAPTDIFTVDTVVPVLSFDFDEKTQSTTFRVTEHYFRPIDLTATVTAKDVNGNEVVANDLTAELQNAEWIREGNSDTYTYTTDNYVSGIYSVRLDFKDLANHAATYTCEQFIIDHESPTDPEITYSQSITDTVLEAVTLGFYNPDVTVTFTSYDKFSGVDHFDWSYDRQSGASSTNVKTYEKAELKATADQTDPSKYTASITLPKKEAEQLRGHISASATDKYKNVSNTTKDNGKVIVVDTVAPTMTVAYSEESNKVGSTLYYGSDKKGQVEVTLNVTEANFFAEDVIVKVSKNGADGYQVNPEWTDVNTDKHTGKFVIQGDGHYIVSVDYKDRSNNKMESYKSNTITIDTIKPVIGVAYQNGNIINTLKDREGNTRKYFDKTQTAVITITEHNFNTNDVNYDIVAKDVTGAVKKIDNLITKSSWSHEGDVHKMTITYAGDANYTFDVECTDLAKNKSEDYQPDYFTVDTVDPTVTSVQYSPSVLETVISNVSFGFYNAKMKVTITATDDTSGVHKFDYSYVTAPGVSRVNASLLDQAIEAAQINYSADGRTATITFEIPKYVLMHNNQFNGSIKFDAIDRSTNKVNRNEGKRIVVDNIAPTANVTYNRPVNQMGGVSYYAGNINGTITINEANFYAEDVHVMVSRNGGAPTALPTSWSHSSADVHIGTFVLTGDADYVVTISYRDKSGNTMASYKSNQMTIDTKIEKPIFTINNVRKSGDNGGAYKDDVRVTFNFQDQNYLSHTVKLTRTRFNKTEDVTHQFAKVTLNGKGGSGSFTIPKDAGYDGIYLLTVTMTDKANHSTEDHVKFIINRFGSVFVYNDYLCDLIKDGGQYVKKDGKAAINKDLVVTEYNADKILDGSLKILITRDGEPIKTIYKTASADTNGWYGRTYTISKNNFKKDGVYKITISSKDATGNTSTSVPANSVDKNGNRILDIMTFTVDTVAPEFQNVINLEKAVAPKDKIVDHKMKVQYKLMDVGGLSEVKIYLNGKLIDTIKDFKNNNTYLGSFYIPESNSVQTVRLVASDMAGNVTDTQSKTYDPKGLFEFHDKVTVSSNFFVRWFRNTPLFIGSILAILALAAALWYFLIGKRRKDDEEEEEGAV